MDRDVGLSRAATWVATLGPVGLWPWGPGTLASAVTAGAWWALGGPRGGWAAGLALLTILGTPAAGIAERRYGPDDGRIVVDEALGMGIALLAAPVTGAGVAAAFVLFRAFDIGKPPPIGRLQRVHGGSGVMLDDVAAGAVAALLVALGARLGLLGAA